MTRSNRFGGVSRMPAQCRAPALLTRQVDPPEALQRLGRHVLDLLGVPNVDLHREGLGPPRASTSAATVKMEPGSFSVDSVLFAATTTLHPAFARPRAMARPIPRARTR